MVAEANLMDRISAGIYSNGTGNGGKDITGLGHLRQHQPRHLDVLAQPSLRRCDQRRRGCYVGQHPGLHEPLGSDLGSRYGLG